MNRAQILIPSIPPDLPFIAPNLIIIRLTLQKEGYNDRGLRSCKYSCPLPSKAPIGQIVFTYLPPLTINGFTADYIFRKMELHPCMLNPKSIICQRLSRLNHKIHDRP